MSLEMKPIILHKQAVEDLEFWAKNDVKQLKRIISLIAEIRKNPFEGIGKPEPLKNNLQGCWSRRIDKEHRLVYTVDTNDVAIISCRFHYAG